MKVLFQTRKRYNTSVAGDSVQLLKTKENLEKLGVDVDISVSEGENLSGYDIIHLYNVTNISQIYGFYQNAVRQKRRIVVSPIYIDMREYYGGKYPERLASWRVANLLRKKVLDGCNYILPNSKAEMYWIKEILWVNTPQKVVYNGVDREFIFGNKDTFIKKFGVQDFVLCVGRISPIKNQLNLIRAVKGLSIPLVLIGPVNDREYARLCAKEAGSNIKYIPCLDHSELACAYKAARVHVQPSWFETVGLSSLEAAVAGTRVVITQRGAAKEYFGDLVTYCDPGDPQAIKQAILKECKEQESNILQEHILENFSWEKTAQTTLGVYQRVLEGPGAKDHCGNGNNATVNYAAEYRIIPKP